MKYYNNLTLKSVCGERILEIFEPDQTFKNELSIFGALFGEKNRFFCETIKTQSSNTRKEKAFIVSNSTYCNGSWFALLSGLDNYEKEFVLFGEVSEGFSSLKSRYEKVVTLEGRSQQLVQIKHVLLLNDPFTYCLSERNAVSSLLSPEIVHFLSQKIILHSELQEEMEERVRIDSAENHSVILEMIGDLPVFDIKPPCNVLFICKLNKITGENDLRLILSQYGDICSCEIIRDWETGESLGYGFVGFSTVAACEKAYFKLNNLIVDDRRIKVGFSQSVAKLWKKYRKALRLMIN